MRIIPGELQNLCSNLSFLRKENALTQVQMAKIFGVGIHAIRQIEKGNFPPRLNCTHLLNICVHFNVSSDSLFLPPDIFEALYYKSKTNQ